MNTEIENNPEETTEEVKMKLDVQVKETSACERHVTVTVPREDIDRYFNKQFDELVPKAEVPGFRAGRAPRTLVENKFRKQVADQVKGSLLMDSLAQISDEQEFAAISEPDLDFETITLPDEGPLTYEFNIEVRPEFDVPDWKGLSLERPEHEFTDDEIGRNLNEFMGQLSDLVPVDEPAKSGDYVVVNLTCRHDGEVVSQSEEETIQLRPKLMLTDATIDGFEKMFIGAESGDRKTATVVISEFSENEKLSGKEVEVEFELLDVKRIDEANRDEIAGKMGMESEEALRKYIESSMNDRLKYAQRQKIRDQISQVLTESASWELPQELLQRQSRRELERTVIEMRSSGFTDDQITTQENTIRQDVMSRTKTMLKEHFILERIAELEEIEESPEDYDREIMRIALQKNDSPRRVRARLERSGQMDMLRNMIVEQKVIDQITEHATFKSVPYDSPDTREKVAISFYAAGRPEVAIPEAKYEPGDQTKLPTAKERD